MSLFRSVLLPAALVSVLGLTRSAAAQASVFATVTASDYEFEQFVSSSFGCCGNTVIYDKGFGPGFTAGGSYNFHRDSRLALGMDARLSYSPGVKGGTYEDLAFRIGLVPDRILLRPYLQTGLGVVSAPNKASNSTAYVGPGFVSASRYTQFAYTPALGLDVKLTDSFDLRLLEIGAAIGFSTGIGVDSGFISTGLVYRFQPLGRTRKP